jgi:hypothetical protein
LEDASVTVKWLLPEPGDAAALAQRARFREIEPRDAETAMGLWLQTLRDGVIGGPPPPDRLSRPALANTALALQHVLKEC